MPDIIDIFSGDAFQMATLTDSINHMDYKPAMLDGMGLFEEEGIATRNVIIEEDYQTLRLVPVAPYGGVAAPRTVDKRKARPFIVPHLPTSEAITAEEIQNVRAYAESMLPQNILMAVESLRNRKLMTMRNDLEATLEHLRIGAIKGQLLDADGSSVIYNLFTEFGVAQQTYNMVLDTATTNVVNKIRAAIRLSLNALGSQVVSGWLALCSDSFFDKLTGHAKVEDKYLNWQGAAFLSDEHRAYGSFPFGGVNWLNYRGSVGGVDFVADTKAYLVPLGARKLFVSKFGPSDYLDRVNQIPSPDGLPIESRAELKIMGKGVDMESQSNPLFLCTKPAAVILLNEHT